MISYTLIFKFFIKFTKKSEPEQQKLSVIPQDEMIQQQYENQKLLLYTKVYIYKSKFVIFFIFRNEIKDRL